MYNFSNVINVMYIYVQCLVMLLMLCTMFSNGINVMYSYV